MKEVYELSVGFLSGSGFIRESGIMFISIPEVKRLSPGLLIIAIAYFVHIVHLVQIDSTTVELIEDLDHLGGGRPVVPTFVGDRL